MSRRRRKIMDLPDGVEDLGDHRFKVAFPVEYEIDGELTDHVVIRRGTVRDSVIVSERLGDAATAEDQLYATVAQVCDVSPTGLDNLPMRVFGKLLDVHTALSQVTLPEHVWRSGDADTGYAVALEFGPSGSGSVELRMEPITIGQRKQAAKHKSPAMQEVAMVAASSGHDTEFVMSLFLCDYARLTQCMSDFLPGEG